MPFFPINLIPVEQENTLTVIDTVDEGRLPPSLPQLSSSQKFLHLLKKIEIAADRQLSILCLSSSFKQSEFYPHQVLTDRISITASSERLHYLLALTLYIQKHAQIYFHHLFESPSSPEQQYCEHLLANLHLQLSLNTIETPAAESSSSAYVTPTTTLLPHFPIIRTSVIQPSIGLSDTPAEEEKSSTRKKSLSPLPATTSSSPERITERIPSPLLPSTTNLSFVESLHEKEFCPSESEDEAVIEDPVIVPSTELIAPLPLPILTTRKRKAKEQPLTTSKKKGPCAAKKQKTTTTTVLPSIIPETSTSFNEFNFVDIKIDAINRTLNFYPHRTMSLPRDLYAFIDIVERAMQYSSYVCLETIPELKHKKISNNHSLVLEALYASVLRNRHFWTSKQKNMPVRLINQFNTILESIHKLYCTNLGLKEPTDIHQHHPALTAYEINPLDPPPPIMNTAKHLFWISLQRVAVYSSEFLIKKTCFESYDGYYVLLQNFIFHLQTSLKDYHLIKKQKISLLKCIDGSFLLTHPKDQSLNPRDIVTTLQKIIDLNQTQLDPFIEHLSSIKSLTFAKKFIEQIKQKIIDHQLLLKDWEKEIALTEKVIDVSISSDESDVSLSADEEPSTSQISKTKSSQDPRYIPYFIKYYPAFNNFSIYEKQERGSITHFLSFLTKIKQCLSCTSYSSQICSSELECSYSDNYAQILKTLFLLVCRHAWIFRQPNKTKHEPCFITSNVVEQVGLILKDINQLYQQALAEEVSEVESLYHPDLNAIASTYELSLFTSNEASFTSFTFSHILVSLNPNTVHIKEKTIRAFKKPKALLKIYETLLYTCNNITTAMSLPEDSSFLMQSSCPSYPLEGCNTNDVIQVNLHTALKHCSTILSSLKDRIDTDPALKEVHSLSGYKKLQKQLKIIEHIKNTLKGKAVTSTELSSNLTPTMPLSLLILTRSGRCFTLKVRNSEPRMTWKNTLSIKNASKTTFQWLSNSFSSKEALPSYLIHDTSSQRIHVYQNSFMTFLPFMYRGLQQNYLQIQYIYKNLHAKTPPPSSSSYCQEALEFVEKSLQMLMNTWKELSNHEGTLLPSLAHLPSTYKDHLPFTIEKAKALRLEIENYIQELPIVPPLLIAPEKDPDAEDSEEEDPIAKPASSIDD